MTKSVRRAGTMSTLYTAITRSSTEFSIFKAAHFTFYTRSRGSLQRGAHAVVACLVIGCHHGVLDICLVTLRWCQVRLTNICKNNFAMLVLRILLIRTFVSLSLVASSYASIDWGECNLNFTRFDGTVAVPPQPIQCARLTVPLDYSKVNSETLDLQLLRVEATLQPSRGSIIYNPGGPGAAGTEFLAFDASQIIE